MVGTKRNSFSSHQSASDESHDATDSNDETEMSPVSKKLTITNDLSYNRKFIIAQENPSEGAIYALRHPRSGTRALYYVASATRHVAELVRVGAEQRSMFYGESVVADGSICLFAPIHPLFLVLHYLKTGASDRFLSLADLLEDSDYPALRLLTCSEFLCKSLKLATDFKELDKVFYFRYNEPKLLGWLSKRFEILRDSLLRNGDLGAEIVGEDLRRYVFGVLCDFLPVELAPLLKAHLEIRDAEAFVSPLTVPMSKRKQSDENTIPTKKTPVKKSKLDERAVRGTQSILSFFSKIK